MDFFWSGEKSSFSPIIPVNSSSQFQSSHSDKAVENFYGFGQAPALSLQNKYNNTCRANSIPLNGKRNK